MTKEDIERYLHLLGHELQIRNTTGNILLLGGAVMLLEVGNRATTQDIDASFEGSNAPLIREAIVAVANVKSWHEIGSTMPRKVFYTLNPTWYSGNNILA